MDQHSPWNGVLAILANIHAPVFSDVTVNVQRYGAKPDGKYNSLPAIQAAIEDCHQLGGGRVVIPAGEYMLAGPIRLKSFVNLHIAEGAVVKFSQEAADYLPVVLTRWEGVECYNYSPLIYAYKQENIAITGKGTLDGQADHAHWWNWSGKKKYGWEEGMENQFQYHSRPRLFEWNAREVPINKRVLGEKGYLRPNFVQFHSCKNILVEDVSLLNSPMWVLHPVLCDNVTIQNVRVMSHGPNSDGCNPESCRHVLIRNCYFDTGDDCIALKSGRNQDGRRINQAVQQVVIQDCEMKDGHGGVVIGSEVSGGAHHIFVENCVMSSPHLGYGIRVKTNEIRGGKIENLFFRNITIGEVSEAVLRVNMQYPIFSDSNSLHLPEVRNIHLENIRSYKSTYGLLVQGYDSKNPVRNLQLKHCQFSGVKETDSLTFTSELIFDNYYVNGEKRYTAEVLYEW